MKEGKGAMKSSGKDNEVVVENGKKKTKEEKPATKVVVRRLPPSMTEDEFMNQIAPLPEIEYSYFVPADMSLMNDAYCRAYISFVHQSDLFIFNEKFDGYVFVDSKGAEFPAVVEFAPFQRIPKNRPYRKKDAKVGTIESDAVYIKFLEHLKAVTLERLTTNSAKQHFFETSVDNDKTEVTNTPLLDYIKHKKAERQRIRDEKREEKRKKDLERKRTKEEQRKIKKEDNPALKVVNSPTSSSKERYKEKDVKSSFVKKKIDDIKLISNDKYTSDSRSKESKTRTGKSYLEERQRQAERREEQRRKLSQTVTDVRTCLSNDDKAVVNNDSLAEVKPGEPENNTKELYYKKPEKSFKCDEGRRNTNKFDVKRDKDIDGRRSKRLNDRSYQNSKREEERSEDSGRKRYSETRRNYDSQRDKYKEKDRNKSQKKTLDSKVDSHKSSVKFNCSNDNINLSIENKVKDLAENNKQTTICTPATTSNILSELKIKTIESNEKKIPSRSNSLDNGSQLSPSKLSENKRSSSVGSCSKLEILDTINLIKECTITKNIAKSETNAKESFENYDHKIKQEQFSNEDKNTNKVLSGEDKSTPKRRNSTGERHSHDKLSPRRNSLGSENKSTISTFHERELVKQYTPKYIKGKSNAEDKQPQSSQDPRTERRIRNKDRPSLEIYRPGMGRFSKQRLGREKGLGSSTEVESPSSSPSPTPVMKHKVLSGS